MGLLLLEMLLALGLALFIVWWVAFPSRRKDDREGGSSDEPRDEPRDEPPEAR